MKTCIITGSDGLIGSNLVRRLCNEYKIVGLDCLNNDQMRNIQPDISYVNVDLSRSDFMAKLDGIDIDLMIHLATVGQEVISKDHTLDKVNITAMLNVLEYCRTKGVPLVFGSSCSVYGKGTKHKESELPFPLTLYGVGKVACEEYAKFYHRMYGMDITILRFSNVYGDTTFIGNKHYQGKRDVVRIFLEQALKGEPLTIINPDHTRDFTFIDDVVEAVHSTMGLRYLNTFNVATGVETSIGDLAKLIGEVLGKDLKTVTIPPRPTDNLERRSLDPSHISDYWRPKYTLKQGLEEYAKRIS